MFNTTRICKFRHSLTVYKQTRACLSLKSPKSSTANLSSAEPETADREMATEWMSPFASAKLGSFAQEAPQLGNQYTQDSLLRSFLKRHIPQQSLAEIEADLTRFGHRVGTDIYDLHLRCEHEQPTVVQTDAWGHRVDDLRTSSAWTSMHHIAAEEGLIALAYERKFGASSRLYQASKLYLFSPSSGLYSCPLAMADGAASLIESIQTSVPWLVERALKRLVSRDPSRFWTSGQWMTEKKGGSDVARGTETVAVEQTDGSYRLYGYKWFSSATDADMTFTLARVVDKHGKTVEGTKGVSLFYLEVRDEDGELNNIQIQKLKNKLGTRQLPTAELLLEGSRAFRLNSKHLIQGIGSQGRKGQLRAASGIPDLEEACDKVGKGAESVLTFAANHSSHLEVAARDFAYSLARVAIGAMLIDHAASSVGSPQDVYTAVRWCEKDLTPVLTAATHNTYTPDATAHDRRLVFDGYLHPSRL